MKEDLIWALGLFAGVILAAALVNRFAPTQRPRVGRIVILYVLYIFAFAAHLALATAGQHVWARRLLVASELLQAFTLVNIIGTIGFAVVLPAAGVILPMIASDLLVGLGYLIATLGALAGHGVETSSVLATSAVVSAVLAISLQSTLGNVVGGVALQLDGSVHEGDWIQLENGKQGRVRSIRWRHTVIETRDWSTIIVPNAQLLANNIMILGKRDGRSVPQRMWVWFNVDFRYAPTNVIRVVTEAMNGSPIVGVASDPPPNCVCMDFTKENRESFATYAIRYWLTDLAADDPTNSRVRERLHAALRRAGIPLAVPATTAFVELHDETRKNRHAERKMAQRLSAVRGVRLFRTLTEAELATIAEGMSHVPFTAGETITRQGAIAHYLYILTGGKAEVRTKAEGATEPKVVATLQAPEVFGEMGLMTGEPRLADVVATTDVDCFRLGKETFEQVLLNRPEMAEEFSATLAARRVELLGAQEDLDPRSRRAHVDQERDRILGAIRSFFSV